MPLHKRKFQKFIKPVIYGLVAVCSAGLIFITAKKLQPLAVFTEKNRLSPGFFVSLLFQKEPKVKLDNNRANIIILGTSGGNHDGANLTDSIILLSIDFKTNDIALISVPRDIWLPSLKTKINSVYYYGEKKQPGGGGFILTKSALSEVLGQSSSYVVKIDFSAFEKIIDLIGGIDVDIEKEFEDKLYPIPGKENDFCGGDPEFLCRYETISFAKGMEHMNGERALKYVRSRYSDDAEGTDFSRSRRQHQVISAIAGKIKSKNSLKDLPTLKRIFDETYKYLETDLAISEILSIGKYFYFNQNPKIRNVVLDTGDEITKKTGLLVNPPLWEYDGVWILAPRTGDYKEIHEYISCQLAKGNCEIKSQLE